MSRAHVIASSLVLLALPLGACSAVPGWVGLGESSGEGTAARPGEHGAGSPDSGAEDAPDAGLALTKLAFIESPTGPRILAAGTDPGARLESVWLELLDGRGEPAVIEPAGDGATEPSQLEVLATSMEVDEASGAFFFEVQSSAGLERFVRTVVARPQDRDGTMGERRSAPLGPRPVHGAGEACDPRGFDVCAEGLACAEVAAEAGGGATRCQDLAAARGRRCTAAPVVTIGGAVRGVVAPGPSLWEPADGCASELRRGRPEAVVRVRVPAQTPSLTVATTADGTTFDSVLSVLSDCSPAAEILACNDDGDPPPTSRVRLSDVGPGDYVVVVDSLDRSGGAFELVVTAP